MQKKMKTFAFDPSFVEVMERVKKDTNHTTLTAMIIQAVTALDKKNRPNYLTPFEHRSLSPEEKAELSLKEENARKEKKLGKYLEMAKALGGTVYTEEATGEVRVQYYRYFENHRDEMDVAVESLTPTIVAEQYIPSKEDIMKRQKAGKTSY